MARSMSVAARLSRPFCAVISTLDRIGIVLRRSTTLWTWASAFRRAARSIVSFMAGFDRSTGVSKAVQDTPFHAARKNRCGTVADYSMLRLGGKRFHPQIEGL